MKYNTITMLIRAIREASDLAEQWHKRNYQINKKQLFDIYYIRLHFKDSTDKLDRLYKIQNYSDLIPKGIFLKIKNEGSLFLDQLYEQARLKHDEAREVNFTQMNCTLANLSKAIDEWISLNSLCKND